MKRIKRMGKPGLKKFIIFKDLDMVNDENELDEIDFFEAFAKDDDELSVLLDVMIDEGFIQEDYEIGTVLDAFELNDFEYCLN